MMLRIHPAAAQRLLPRTAGTPDFLYNTAVNLLAQPATMPDDILALADRMTESADELQAMPGANPADIRRTAQALADHAAGYAA